MEGYGMMKRGMSRKKDVMGRMTSEVELPSLQVPPGVELSGDSGTAEIDWRMLGDGRIEVTAINGVSLSGESEGENAESSMEGEQYA